MMHPPLDPIADQAQRDWRRVTRAEQDQLDYARDQTIAERIDQIEFMLKFVPEPWYREELEREYLALTTDPEERYERA